MLEVVLVCDLYVAEVSLDSVQQAEDSHSRNGKPTPHCLPHHNEKPTADVSSARHQQNLHMPRASKLEQRLTIVRCTIYCCATPET